MGRTGLHLAPAGDGERLDTVQSMAATAAYDVKPDRGSCVYGAVLQVISTGLAMLSGQSTSQKPLRVRFPWPFLFPLLYCPEITTLCVVRLPGPELRDRSLDSCSPRR